MLIAECGWPRRADSSRCRTFLSPLRSFHLGPQAVPAAEGVLEAGFDGKHGWFWRNRGKTDVTVILKTDGEYTEIKRMM